MNDLPVEANPGPIARLESLKADASIPAQVFLRLCDGESLKQIARAWQVPKGPFVLWYMSVHRQLFDDAERVRAQDLKAEALEISDEQNEVERPGGGTFDPDVQRDKLRVDTRLKLLEKLDRERFGRFTKHEHTHTHDLGERLRRARERVIEQAPDAVTLGPVSPSGVSPAPAPEPVVDAELI